MESHSPNRHFRELHTPRSNDVSRAVQTVGSLYTLHAPGNTIFVVFFAFVVSGSPALQKWMRPIC